MGYCCDRPSHATCWWNVDFGIWIRKAVEIDQQGLIGHTSRDIVHSGAKSNMAYDFLAQEFSEKHISKLCRDSHC